MIERKPKIERSDMLPREITIGDKYGPAMEITEQDAADAYFERCVEHNMRTAPHSREEAERIERINLGYYAGYYSTDTRRRVETLFRCAHPVFGSVEKNGASTFKEALYAGMALGTGKAAVADAIGRSIE